MAGKGSKPGERRGGRKKGVKNRITADVKALLDSVVDWKKLAGALNELALGVVVRKIENGKEKVYDKPPDPAAAKILFEYRFGKAPQPITGDNENPVKHTMTVIFKDAE